MPVDLSPRASALSMLDALAPDKQGACSPEAHDELARAPQCELAGPDEAASVERLQRALAASATEGPHLRGRPAPQLRRHADGTYQYRGHVFDARIARDGSVAFRDRTTGAWVGLGFDMKVTLNVPFDLNDKVDKLQGKELYPAEKRWFLEQTEAFRDELAQAHQSDLRARMPQLVRGHLRSIVADPVLTPADKRNAVFALWDDCADDDVGLSAQKLVEAFIREHMPEGSALAYDRTELERLNAIRASRRAFDPYAVSDAGVSAPG
jgi:hypothetical protein